MRIYFTVFFLITIWSSNHAQSVISRIESISKSKLSTKEQVEKLLILESDLRTEYPADSLGMLMYFIANRLGKNKDYDKSISYAREAITLFGQVGYDGYRLHNCYFFIINALSQYGKHKQIVALYKDVSSLSKSTIKQRDSFGALLNDIGNAQNLIGEYYEAAQLFSEMFSSDWFGDLSLQNKKVAVYRYVQSLIALGGNLELSKALRLLDSIPQYYEAEGMSLSFIDVSNISLEKEKIFLKLKEFDKVIRLTDDIIADIDVNDLNSETSEMLCDQVTNKFVALFDNNDFVGANKLLLSIKPLVDSSHSFSDYDVMVFYQNLGESYRGVKGYTNSLISYDSAFSKVGFHLDSDPAEKLSFSDNLNDVIELSLDYLKTRQSDKMYFGSRLNLSECFIKIDTLIQFQLTSVLSEGSILTLSEEYFEFYSSMSDYAFVNQDVELFLRACERKRGILFLEHWANTSYSDLESSNYYLGIIDSLEGLKIEYDISTEFGEPSLDQSEVEALNTLIITSKLERNSLIIESPLNIVELEDVKANFKSEILYFQYGADSLYALHISESDESIINLGPTYLIDSIVKEHLHILKSGEGVTSSSLYDILLAPFSIQKSSVLIVPDAILNFVPFESIPTGKSADPYFIDNYEVSYSVSLALSQSLMRTSLNNIEHMEILSPLYNRENLVNQLASISKGLNKDNFDYLHFSNLESTMLKQLLKGSLIKTGAIKRDSFYHALESSDIFHFTGHAILNPVDYRFSFLALGDKEEGYDNLVTMSEIDHAETNADLIYLNACNTGNGRLLKGEGVFSLARSFFRAGAKSVVNSLWSIDDQSSSIITISFYKYLKEGHTKSYALAQAKRDYLNSDIPEFKKHPYYWAGLILVGNDAPLKFGNWYDNYLIPCGILLILSLSFLTYRRKPA